MKHIKLIISTVIVLMTAMSGANAVVCKKMVYNVPTSCGDYEGSGSSWFVWGCAGGSVDSFEGETRCSTSDGTFAQPGNPTDSGGGYCWCRLIIHPVAFGWVFQGYLGGPSNCWNVCPGNCGAEAYVDFHLPIGIVQRLWWLIMKNGGNHHSTRDYCARMIFRTALRNPAAIARPMPSSAISSFRIF
jgi:hypothetical protein